MSRSRVRSGVVGVVAAGFLIGLTSALLVPAVAADTGRLAKTVAFEETTLSAPVETANGWPNVGGTEVVAGIVTRKLTDGSKTRVEHAAFRHDDTMTGHPTPTTYTLKGGGPVYSPNGSTRTKYEATITVAPDGSSTVTGKGTSRGVSGDLKGMTAEYTLTGTRTSPTGVSTTYLKGSRHT